MNSGRLGRFGNQMFQYASTMGIAKSLGFDYGANYSNKSEHEYLHFLLPDVFVKLTAKDCSNHMPRHFIKEPTWHFNEFMFQIKDNTDIFGYFQSEKYFVKFKDDIKKEFIFKDEIKDTVSSIRKSVSDPVISIHMRLGDYKNYPTKHPICSFEYYENALELLPKDLMVFIFSDEPELAKERLSKLNRKHLVVDNMSGPHHMCLMNMCDYHIIANSSFSWWGAWLANSKQVIAPKKWFGEDHEMPKIWDSIYCENWITV
jgi:hypothetical protein